MMRARAQKMLPMLMPALAAEVRVWEGDEEEKEADGEGVGVVTTGVDEGEVADEEVFEGEDEGFEDDEGDETDAVTIDDDAEALEVAAALCVLRIEGGHVCGSTASFEVRSKVGVLAKSSPDRSSSCIWQIPWVSYWL